MESRRLLIFVVLVCLFVKSHQLMSGSGSGEKCQLQQCRPPVMRKIVLPSEMLLTECSLQQSCSNCTLCSSLPSSVNSPEIFQSGLDYSYEINIENTTAEDAQILLKIEGEGQSETFTSYQMINKVNESFKTTFENFICSEIMISYAWIINNTYSDFSPSIALCLNTGAPMSATNITLTVKGTKNCTKTNNTAVINLNWKPPNDSFLLSHYTLNVTSSAQSGYCHSNSSILTTIQKNATNTIVQASDKDLSIPLFGCDYIITLTSHPGGYKETTTYNLKLNTPSLTRNCETIFDQQRKSYNLTIRLTLNPNDCSIISHIIRFELQLRAYSSYIGGALPRSDLSYPPIFQNIVLDTMVSEYYEYTFSGISPRRTGQGYFVNLNSFLTEHLPAWNAKLNSDDACIYSTPPKPPTQMDKAQIKVFTIDVQTRIATLSISWSPPLYSNGDLTEYQVLIRSRFSGSDRESLIENINNNTFEYDMTFFSELYSGIDIQVRTTNQWCQQDYTPCYSTWSEALQLQIPDNATLLNPVIITNTTSSMIPSPSPTTDTGIDSFFVEVPPDMFWSLIGASIGLVILIIVLVIFIIICCCCGGRCIKRQYAMAPMLKISETGVKNFIEFSKDRENTTTVNDGWEIARNLLEVHEDDVLGSGCFGEVCKGSLQMNYVLNKRRLSHDYFLHQKKRSKSLTPEYFQVAVKRLKRTADGKERSDFLKEIEVMRKVSEPDSDLKRFVVNMIGCCRLEEPILLIIEFVKYGNLLTYLRTMKKKSQMARGGNISDDPAPYLEPLGTYSNLEPKSQLDDEGHLTEKNLLSFSRQIASGMEYLVSLDIVHRDLACRNILVGEGRELKISDFGLSRVVPQDEVYTLTSHGRLPLRWMALESIFQREFTSASDVWAYGIVLWEICTMGAFPYSTLQEKDLLKLLKKGYRLPKPSNCSQEVFQVMHQCWHPEPKGRPKFTDLHKLFDYFLSRHTQEQYPYIDMDSMEPYTYDHLTHKAISSYPTNEEVLDLDDEEVKGIYAGEGESSDYGSAKDLRLFSPSDENLTEVVDRNTVECLNESLKTDSNSAYDKLRTIEHPYLTRISNSAASDIVFDYNRFIDDEEDEYYSQENEHSLHSYDFYDHSLWMKKLSTITEVSYEDYGDQTEGTTITKAT